jgi:hypothetical protein
MDLVRGMISREVKCSRMAERMNSQKIPRNVEYAAEKIYERSSALSPKIWHPLENRQETGGMPDAFPGGQRLFMELVRA